METEGESGAPSKGVAEKILSKPAMSFFSHPMRFFTTPKPSKLLTKIHGKWYDLTEFENRHPGGRVALGLSRGRDATVLFESHHPFANRASLDAILSKHEIDASDSKHLETLEQRHGVPEHSFEWPSAFGAALKAEVKEYFEGEARRRGVSLRSATKATPWRCAEIAVLTAMNASTIPGFFRGDWRFLFLFPLTMWLQFANSFHDATHFALSSNWRLNALVPYIASFPFLLSPFTWYHQHNIGHHAYTNIRARDPDLLHYSWWRREHRDVHWTPAHKFQSQWWHIAIFWSLAFDIALGTTNDIWMLQTSLYNDVVPMAPISGLRCAAHVLARGAVVAFVHLWPLLWCDSWAKAAAFAIVPYATFSVLFMFNTQINHLVPQAVHAEHADWYKHQVVTTLDFAVGRKLCDVFSGGLNYQVAHHLFPTVNHCHLPHVQPIVARLCEKFDVRYDPVKGYVEANALHYEHSAAMATQ